jgi:membrane associated rhomboid family serine protease
LPRRRNLFGAVPPITLQLMIATGGATLLCVILANFGIPQVLDAFVYRPHDVIPGLRVWKLLTYLFVLGSDPIGFIFGLLVLYFFGGWFERSWGSQRFMRFFLISGAGAALLPLVVSPFSARVAGTAYFGNWAVLEALTVAMGMLQPDIKVYLYFVLPVTARQLMYVSWGLIGLFIVFNASVVPYLTAIGGVGMGLPPASSANCAAARATSRWFRHPRARATTRRLTCIEGPSNGQQSFGGPLTEKGRAPVGRASIGRWRRAGGSASEEHSSGRKRSFTG